MVITPPAAAPAAALEPALACAASPDLTEAPPPLCEEPSPKPPLAPATEEELLLGAASGPALEPPVEPVGFVSPSFFDLFLLLAFFIMFSFSPWHNSVFHFLIFNLGGSFGSFLIFFSFFLFLPFIFPLPVSF